MHCASNVPYCVEKAILNAAGARRRMAGAHGSLSALALKAPRVPLLAARGAECDPSSVAVATLTISAVAASCTASCIIDRRFYSY